MVLPPVLVGIVFLAAVVGALLVMGYIAWRGAKPSDFFQEAVGATYELELSEQEIDGYYDLKEKLQRQYAPEALNAPVEEEDEQEEAAEPWTRKVPPEERQALQKALMHRLVSCISKLDQVQRDKPGNWKLWQTKLVSERYWGSLVDAEKVVSQEIDACVAEAEEIEPGWRDHIFPQAVQCYRMQKQQEHEKKMVKKAVEHEKKQKVQEVKRKEVEKRMEIEDKVRQEKLAAKMMEQLLREEEAASSSSKKTGKSKAVAKPKAKKKVK